MSGIFGLLDPLGVDARALTAAAQRASFRGRPVVQALGPVALGAYLREGSSPAVVWTAAGITVADARVDEVVGAAAHTGSAGVSLLDGILATRGPDRLADVAGDFALARWDPERRTLTLSRDAFGRRPLVWGRRGRRVGFASDPQVLVSLGLASGEPDRRAVASYLALRDWGGEHTEFEGVRRVLGGRWICLDLDGRVSEGRWFRPEDVAPEPRPAEEVAEHLAEALTAAVTSRARRRRVTLLLSGGRDSGAVAVALARGGLRGTCLTQTFDPVLHCSEEDPARRLAEAMGHRWIGVPAPDRVTETDLEAMPAASGTPLASPTFPQALALRNAVVSTGGEIVLDGDGGEPLFAASPVAVLDLLRRGRIGAAGAAAHGFHHRWVYPYPVVAKAVLRALLPRPVLTVRERLRPAPPWVAGVVPPDRGEPARTARAHLVSALLAAGGDPAPEQLDRLFAHAGLEYASPLLDLRVVRLALSLPVDLRVPVPTPKPLLAQALLDGFDASRRKARFTGYYARLSESVLEDFPDLFGPCAMSVRRGYVLGHRLGPIAHARWGPAVLPLVNLETWLRSAA
jgi:asparagine synthetase B (glutamine-hydrolysing)